MQIKRIKQSTKCIVGKKKRDIEMEVKIYLTFAKFSKTGSLFY